MAGFSTINRYTPYYEGAINVVGPGCVPVSTPNQLIFDKSNHFNLPQKAHGSAYPIKYPFPPSRYGWVTDPRISDRFYGNFVLERYALPPKQVLHTVSKRPKSTFRDFKARREANQVVVNWLVKANMSAVVEPGAYQRDITDTTSFKIAHPNAGKDLTELVATGCAADPTGILWPSGDVTYGSWNGLGGGIHYDWHEVPDDKYGYPVSEHELKDMLDTIHFAITTNVERDKCLITSVVAEQRSGVVDLLTSLMEAPESIDSIIHASEKIVRYYKEARGKVKRLATARDPDLGKATADVWLNYRYNIMPNVYLIEDALYALRKGNVAFKTARQGNLSSVEGFTLNNGWHVPEIRVHHSLFMKSAIKAGYRTTLGAWPPTTAWELFPLSFVWDWVINVGDVLQALRPSAEVTSEGMLYVLRTDDDLELTHPEWKGAPIRVNLNTYHASVITDADIGLTVSPDFSIKRRLDALALSWSTIREALKEAKRSFRHDNLVSTRHSKRR